MCWNFLGNKVCAQMFGFTAWESSLHVGTAETTFVKMNSSWGVGHGEGMRETSWATMVLVDTLMGINSRIHKKRRRGKNTLSRVGKERRKKKSATSNCDLFLFFV